MNEGFLFLLAIIVYIITCYPTYLLAKKAHYDYAFFAFIPILSFVLVLNIAGMNGWYLLIMLVPFVNIIFAIVVSYKFFDSFENGLTVFGISIVCSFIALVFPLISIGAGIAMWWLALSDNSYIGELWGYGRY